MKSFLKTFIADESGASAAEYALILAIVGVGIGAAALALGANVKEAIKSAAVDVYDCGVDPAAASASSTGTATC